MRLKNIDVSKGGYRVVGTLLGLSALLISSSTLAQLPPDGGASVEVTDSAREQFQVGVALLQDPDGARYEEALRAFKKAYEDSPSWKILGNLGVCALKLERFDEGIEAMSRYLKYGGAELSDQERSQFARDLKVMQATGGTLKLRVTGASSVTLRDTRTRSVGGPISNTYDVADDGTLELIVAGGKHTLEVQSGEMRAQREVMIDSGQTVDVALELKEEQTAELPVAAVAEAPTSADGQNTANEPARAEQGSGSGIKTAGYVTAGVGVAALIGAGVTAALGFSKKGKLSDECPDKTCTFADAGEEDDYNKELDSLKTLGTLTTAFAIGGGVLAAAGVTMIIVGGKGGSRENATLQLIPSIGPAWTGLSAQGAF